MDNYELDAETIRTLRLTHAGNGLSIAGNDVSAAPNMKADAYASGFTRPAHVSRGLENILQLAR